MLRLLSDVYAHYDARRLVVKEKGEPVQLAWPTVSVYKKKLRLLHKMFRRHLYTDLI